MAQNLQSAVEVWFASIGTAPDYKTMHYWEGANQSEFDINFAGGYISREHVKAFIRNDTTGVSTPVAVTFLTASRVSVTTPVPVGYTICIYRDTPKNAPLALFVDGAIMNAVNFDRNAKQSVFAVAELLDRFDVTNSMAEEAILRASEAKEAAAQAAADAASAESKVAIAQTAATAAEASAQSAAELAGTADTNASNALSVANGIDAKATQALSNSRQAVATAQDAEAVANSIDGKATNALSQSTAAVATANTALTTANAIEGKADKALQAAKPVLALEWVPKRAAMWVGHVPADGQLLNRADYPDAWEAINSGLVPVVLESEWLSDPQRRGCYTSGNGSTTFRIPDYNGKSAGSLGAAFLRGDGLNSASNSGVIQNDAIRNITGKFGGGSSGSFFHNGPHVAGAGAFGADSPQGSFRGTLDNTAPSSAINFDASRVVPTAEDNHPVNVTGCWAIRLFGVVQNPGQIDAANLATQMAVVQGRISLVEGQITALEQYPRVVSVSSVLDMFGIWIANETEVSVVEYEDYYHIQGIFRTRNGGAGGGRLFAFKRNIKLSYAPCVVSQAPAAVGTYPYIQRDWVGAEYGKEIALVNSFTQSSWVMVSFIALKQP